MLSGTITAFFRNLFLTIHDPFPVSSDVMYFTRTVSCCCDVFCDSSFLCCENLKLQTVHSSSRVRNILERPCKSYPYYYTRVIRQESDWLCVWQPELFP
jgi:hypothetical protein